MENETEKLATKLTAELSDAGKIIEAGWVGFKLLTISKDAPQIQLDEMRQAFFAGAQHLFSSILNVLEEGEEPTDKDLNRLSLIHKELDDFLCNFKEKHFSGGRSGRA